ncbi:MAG: S49 family peptidase, partial [Anaerolineales bacterium]
PVVIVMGPVAASGGYYVATPGNWIIAQPNTITGSIGVLYGKFAIGEMLKKIFINRELISRGEAALFLDPGESWSEEQKVKIWNSVNRIYKLFLERVADSRNMSAEAVGMVGGGRVWTGRQALHHELIDELGGLDDAIKKARELAGLREDAAVRMFYPDKVPVPPLVGPTAAISYVLGAVKMLNERAIIYFPWVQH